MPKQEEHIHTDQNKRAKPQTRGTHKHRSKQKHKGTNKRNTYTQIKTKEQRHKQEEHIHTDQN